MSLIIIIILVLYIVLYMLWRDYLIKVLILG